MLFFCICVYSEFLGRTEKPLKLHLYHYVLKSPLIWKIIILIFIIIVLYTCEELWGKLTPQSVQLSVSHGLDTILHHAVSKKINKLLHLYAWNMKCTVCGHANASRHSLRYILKPKDLWKSPSTFLDTVMSSPMSAVEHKQQGLLFDFGFI